MNPLRLNKKDYKRYCEAQSFYEGEHYFRLAHADKNGMKYQTPPKDYVFWFTNKKSITLPGLMRSNGADVVADLIPLAWFVHDRICVSPYWDDYTPISNLMASWIYRKILVWNGVKVISWGRFLATFLFGGDEVKRQVGWVTPQHTKARP